MDTINEILEQYYKMIKKEDIDIDDLRDLNKLSDDQKKTLEIVINFFKLGRDKRFEYRSASP